jgi:outer membrane protein
LVTDRRNVVVAAYALVAAIGRLNAQELGVAALVYDPEAHYREVRNKWFDISITRPDGRRETLPPPPPPPKRGPPAR